jgi:hypothetical protein
MLLERYRTSSPAKILTVAKQVLGQPHVELLTMPAKGGK